ncbi:copper chaperone PCu(A)C [Thermaurantiacus sp.]
MSSNVLRLSGFAACAVSTLLLVVAVAGGRWLELPAQAQEASQREAPKASGAWVRLPAAAGRPAAGYLELLGRPGDALVGVSSPVAGRVELHSMTSDGGVMRMRAESRLEFDSAGRLALAPGGNHLMLFDLDPTLKPGGRVPLTLRFASGASSTVTAEARPAASSAHQH